MKNILLCCVFVICGRQFTSSSKLLMIIKISTHISNLKKSSTRVTSSHIHVCKCTSGNILHVHICTSTSRVNILSCTNIHSITFAFRPYSHLPHIIYISSYLKIQNTNILKYRGKYSKP